MNEKLFRILLWLRKSIMTTAIIVLVLLPKTIYREKLNTKIENFQTTFTHVEFHPQHLFCDVPKSDSMRENEDLDGLNLPNETIITDDLREVGQCLAKMKSEGKSLDPCSCQKRPAYIVLLVVSVAALFLDYVRFCVLPTVSGCFRTFDTVSSSRQECFMLFDAIVWFIVALFSALFHVYWFDEIWLPDAIYSQNYFARPLLWSFAVCLSFVCWICCVMELAYLKSRRSKLSEDYREMVDEHVKEVKKLVEPKVALVEAKVKPVEDRYDTWSVESYSEEVKERLLYHVFRKKWNKTWP